VRVKHGSPRGELNPAFRPNSAAQPVTFCSAFAQLPTICPAPFRFCSGFVLHRHHTNHRRNVRECRSLRLRNIRPSRPGPIASRAGAVPARYVLLINLVTMYNAHDRIRRVLMVSVDPRCLRPTGRCQCNYCDTKVQTKCNTLVANRSFIPEGLIICADNGRMSRMNLA